MSFILDALKKSEAERQRQAGPALLEMRVVRPRRRAPVWVWVVGGVVVLLNFVALGWLLLNRNAGTSAGSPASAPAATTPAAAAATAAPATVPATAPAVARAAMPPLSSAPPMAAALPDSIAENPADLEPAMPAGSSSGRDATLQNYSEVSANLPELRLDLHGYASKPADRWALINMRRVKEGDITAEGMRVVEITRDGVVLNYRNSEFVLRRE